MVKAPKSNEEFKVGTGLLRGFMKRYSLSLHQKASVAQKDTNQVIDKLVFCILVCLTAFLPTSLYFCCWRVHKIYTGPRRELE